ncbi:amino acid-binding protein [Luteococcus sp.]|uniref:amino acid-binding protein n=1 Tax=Luteococcus sp. TaxID=1969402 RepID=UPI003734E24F
MHLLRVELPSRPGSLGVVASAMGRVDVDIIAVEVLETLGERAVDDFIVSVPPGMMMDTLVSACDELEGVKVLWVSRYPESWGIQGDIELLDAMLDDPGRALDILVSEAPEVFHCQWAAVVDHQSGTLGPLGAQAPELDAAALASFGPLDRPHAVTLPAQWLPHWSETLVAVAPIDERRSLLLGRAGGPVFLASERHRLEHLAALSCLPARHPRG